ncbi:BLUF domain-containing protein [Parasphingorhabdus cellanae]|uniref:BLUF domain-containing protein n=1 Tax=Parasphingorhabdus cellanae TaxID=2806553 RepID=A0ABX7T708_9SPHN|nr:BLUF domain-containing protein [Parasphingorhabdus cellanae]QTD57381.1 BLUF domain-containing protein [Parasphingorhabdus cellanae]
MTDYSINSVIYISTARSDLSPKDFSDIVEISRRKNADLGITGILCFNGTNFIQFLEGDRKIINDQLRLIGSDNRHSGMITMNHRTTKKREFPDWHMASSVINLENQNTDQKLTDILAIGTVSEETREIFNNFRSIGLGM